MYNNKVKIIITILFIIFAVGVVVLIVGIAKRASHNASPKLDVIRTLTLNGMEQTVELVSADTTIVLIFNSECDICVYELEELLDDSYLFMSYRIIILSRQSFEDLQNITELYDLWSYPNIDILKIEDQITGEPYISSPNPSVFVYDTNAKLIYSKKGYAKPRFLIQVIKEN
jgi:hypothetical protein